MQDQPPPLLPLESFAPDSCPFSRSLCCLTWNGGTIHWVLQSDLELSPACLGVPDDVSMELNILA